MLIGRDGSAQVAPQEGRFFGGKQLKKESIASTSLVEQLAGWLVEFGQCRSKQTCDRHVFSMRNWTCGLRFDGDVILAGDKKRRSILRSHEILRQLWDEGRSMKKGIQTHHSPLHTKLPAITRDHQSPPTCWAWKSYGDLQSSAVLQSQKLVISRFTRFSSFLLTSSLFLYYLGLEVPLNNIFIHLIWYRYDRYFSNARTPCNGRFSGIETKLPCRQQPYLM
jgi:hypothetical protein